MNILVLDDQNDRHLIFDVMLGAKHQIYHVATATDAMNMLRNNRYQMVFLDHDLGQVQDGADVVNYIVKLEADLRPDEVCVHSANVVEGPKMVTTLKEAGVTSAWAEFGSRTFEKVMEIMKDWE